MAHNQIGDYIHSNYWNYQRWGLNKVQQAKNPVSPTVIAAAQRMLLRQEVNRIRGRVSQGVLDKLERTVNSYFRRRENSSVQIEEEGGLSLDKIEEILQRAIGSSAIDFDRLVGSGMTQGGFSSFRESLKASNLEDTYTMNLAKYRKVQDSSKRRVSVIIRKVNNLISIMNLIASNGFASYMSQSKKNEFIQNVQRLEAEKQSLIETAGGTNKLVSAKETEDIIRVINKSIKLLKDERSNVITGYLGEMIVYLMVWAEAHKADEVTDQLIDSFVQGLKEKVINQSTTKNVLKSSNFSTNILLNEETVNRQRADGNTKIVREDEFSAIATKDLVDMSFYSDIDNQKYNLSIKNVNLHSGFNVGIRSGSNILMLIQDYGLFVNHMLNVLANVRDDPISPGGGDIVAMQNALKLTIFLRALIGGIHIEGGKKSEVADFFVIRDNSNSGNEFQFFYVGDILSQVENNISLLEISGLPVSSSDLSFSVANTWVGPEDDPSYLSANKRITNLINYLKSISYKVQLKPEMFLK